VFSIIVPYLLCSINPAIIIAKIKSGKDIRELGSGSAGLTNSFRTMGKKVAGLVLLLDVLKGAVSIWLIVLFFTPFQMDAAMFESTEDVPIHLLPDFIYLCMWIGSLSGVLGHCYPIWHRFKGGKAVLVTAATGLVINWLAAVIAVSLFVLLAWATKYVSVGSIIAAIAYVVCVWLLGHIGWGFNPVPFGVIYASAIALILIVKHKDNIKRLIAGNENKLGSNKEKNG
jgi:glycerol-3-phosphate acyltransferase PlsY